MAVLALAPSPSPDAGARPRPDTSPKRAADRPRCASREPLRRPRSRCAAARSRPAPRWFLPHVLALQSGQPRLDLGLAEVQAPSDAEPARPAALAAQVVERLRRNVEVVSELGQGQDGLEQVVDSRVCWSHGTGAQAAPSAVEVGRDRAGMTRSSTPQWPSLAPIARTPTWPLTSEFGGAEGTRTPDPLHAMQMRYQLRHSPAARSRRRGPTLEDARARARTGEQAGRCPQPRGSSSALSPPGSTDIRLAASPTPHSTMRHT